MSKIKVNYWDELMEAQEKEPGHIVVGHRQGIALPLDRDQQVDVLHTGQILRQGHKEKIADLLGEVLLLHRGRDQTLLDIIADHGARELQTAQRGQESVDILDRLFQIKADDGDLRVPGKTKTPDRFRHAASHFHIHGAILQPDR